MVGVRERVYIKAPSSLRRELPPPGYRAYLPRIRDPEQPNLQPRRGALFVLKFIQAISAYPKAFLSVVPSNLATGYPVLCNIHSQNLKTNLVLIS